jgi:hypothetical protein
VYAEPELGEESYKGIYDSVAWKTADMTPIRTVQANFRDTAQTHTDIKSYMVFGVSIPK